MAAFAKRSRFIILYNYIIERKSSLLNKMKVDVQYTEYYISYWIKNNLSCRNKIANNAWMKNDKSYSMYTSAVSKRNKRCVFISQTIYDIS